MIIDCGIAKQTHSAKLKLTLYWGHDQTCEKVMENMKKKCKKTLPRVWLATDVSLASAKRRECIVQEAATEAHSKCCMLS